MTILELLPVQSMLGVPFTDYLNVSVPVESSGEVVSRLMPVLEGIGFLGEDSPGTFRLYDGQLKATGAVFKFSKRGKVMVISASGMALQAMRNVCCYDDYLRELSLSPHRVTMLHATQDYFVLSPSAVVLGVKEAAFAGELALTRKKLLPSQVKVLLSPDSAGDETGTVYLGHRANADVWAKIYDKRHERLQRGCVDPGPIVRVEIAVQSDVGATLKDAHNPHDLFFQFASKSLVAAPPEFKGWAPSGEGFACGEGREVLPHDRLDRLLDFSLDVSRLISVAVSMYGDKAGDVLSRHLAKKCNSVYEASCLAA